MNSKGHRVLDRNTLSAAMKHPIIRNFLSDPVNASSIHKYFSEASDSNLEKIDRAFKIYFFALRFTKYLSSLIHQGRIDFVRRFKRNESREVSVYDKPISDDEVSTIGEMLTSVYHGDDLPQVTVNPDVFQEQLNNEWLYEGFSQLTTRQKYVITLAYSTMSRDSEIAHLLHVSQQSVSKTRIKALRKMRQAFPVYKGVQSPLKKGG